LGGGPVGTETDGGGPEEETLASAEPELEAVMAEEFSTSIGIWLTTGSKLLSFFPTPIPN
jgi:hypothetical protein